MLEEKIITGATEDDIWQQVTDDLTRQPDLLEYNVAMVQNTRRINLAIFIDLGGGFEGGFESTMMRTPLNTMDDFKFAVHHQGFIDEIGKFFGMQDVVVGFPEFDKRLIIKSNNEPKVKTVFADALVREVFESLAEFNFGIIIHHIDHHQKVAFLEFYSDVAITDPATLKKIYTSFNKVLGIIDPIAS